VGGSAISTIVSPRPAPAPAARQALARIAGTGDRVVLARQRLLEVPAPLAPLLPDGGLRRGSTLTLAAGAGQGGTSLALALAGPASRAGSWVAAVGAPALGLVAAAQLGVALERLALVPDPGTQWPIVTAALVDSVDVVLVAPTGRVRFGDARRLVAKARERGAVLVVLTLPGRGRWPEPADLDLIVEQARWEGLEGGAGHLRTRTVEVVATGRRSAARPRRVRVLLPGPDGLVAAASPETPAVSPLAGGRPTVGAPASPAVGGWPAVGASLADEAETAVG